VFFDGAVYHVCNRSARGERVFEESNLAARFVELLKEVTRARELLASLGLARYGLQVKMLAELSKKHPATATGWVMRGVRKRTSNPYFRVRYEELGRHLIGG